MEFTPVILAHLFTAVGAIIIGGITLLLRKGTPTHRLFGRVWVALMLTTALASFGIQTSGHFSWIHLLSLLTLVSVSVSLYAIINGRVRRHERGMRSAYIGLAIAAVFTLLPGRRLGHLVWHAVGLI